MANTKTNTIEERGGGGGGEGPSGTSNTMTARRKSSPLTHKFTASGTAPSPLLFRKAGAAKSTTPGTSAARAPANSFAANRFVWTGTGPLGRSDCPLECLASHVISILALSHNRGCTAVCLWWRCRSRGSGSLMRCWCRAVVVERPMTHILFAILYLKEGRHCHFPLLGLYKKAGCRKVSAATFGVKGA